MNVLIVENEMYLAQSIAAKLSEKGFTCDIVASPNEAMGSVGYDVVLLSTNLATQGIKPIIEHHRHAIVILLVSYVSSDTVTNPLKAGAKDYILKPFMIEELLRKIEHYREFDRLERENVMLHSYIDFALKEYKNSIDASRPLPLLLKASHQRLADAYVFEYASSKGFDFEFITTDVPQFKAKFAELLRRNASFYLAGLERLKKAEREEVIQNLSGVKAIVSTTDEEDQFSIATVEIKNSALSFQTDNILPIDDYVKLVVLNNQDRYPDTELSKKLGMSRKSLWEKRKKYGIEKRK